MSSQRKTLILTQSDIERLLDLKVVIGVVRRAFIAMERQKAAMPPKVYLRLPSGDDFRAMPAYLKEPAACGLKWVNVHAGNPKRGLPTVMAVYLANDPKTGFPLAIMDGLLMTKWRTAAAAAVAAKALARKRSRSVAFVGCGAQAPTQLLALVQLLPIQAVRVWGPKRGEAARFKRSMMKKIPGLQWTIAPTVRECVMGADIIVTLTPSRKPLIRRSWIAPGVHINAIGADAPGKQELDPEILKSARIIVDDRAQAIHGGEINVAVRKRQLNPSRIHAQLGEVLTGRRSGRRNPREITVFDSTGLAIHDVALGYEILKRANRRKIGRRVALFRL